MTVAKNKTSYSVCVKDFEILPAPKGPLLPQETIRHMFQYNAHSHPSKPGYQIKRTMNGCVCVFYPWKLDPVEHDTLK